MLANKTSEMLLRLLHNRELEDLCLSRHLVLISRFDSASLGLGPTKIILSGPKFLNLMGSTKKYSHSRRQSDVKILLHPVTAF